MNNSRTLENLNSEASLILVNLNAKAQKEEKKWSKIFVLNNLLVKNTNQIPKDKMTNKKPVDVINENESMSCSNEKNSSNDVVLYAARRYPNFQNPNVLETTSKINHKNFEKEKLYHSNSIVSSKTKSEILKGINKNPENTAAVNQNENSSFSKYSLNNSSNINNNFKNSISKNIFNPEKKLQLLNNNNNNNNNNNYNNKLKDSCDNVNTNNLFSSSSLKMGFYEKNENSISKVFQDSKKKHFDSFISKSRRTLRRKNSSDVIESESNINKNLVNYDLDSEANSNKENALINLNGNVNNNLYSVKEFDPTRNLKKNLFNVETTKKAKISVPSFLKILTKKFYLNEEDLNSNNFGSNNDYNDYVNNLSFKSANVEANESLKENPKFRKSFNYSFKNRLSNPFNNPGYTNDNNNIPLEGRGFKRNSAFDCTRNFVSLNNNNIINANNNKNFPNQKSLENTKNELKDSSPEKVNLMKKKKLQNILNREITKIFKFTPDKFLSCMDSGNNGKPVACQPDEFSDYSDFSVNLKIKDEISEEPKRESLNNNNDEQKIYKIIEQSDENSNRIYKIIEQSDENSNRIYCESGFINNELSGIYNNKINLKKQFKNENENSSKGNKRFLNSKTIGNLNAQSDKAIINNLNLLIDNKKKMKRNNSYIEKSAVFNNLKIKKNNSEIKNENNNNNSPFSFNNQRSSFTFKNNLIKNCYKDFSNENSKDCNNNKICLKIKKTQNKTQDKNALNFEFTNNDNYNSTLENLKNVNSKNDSNNLKKLIRKSTIDESNIWFKNCEQNNSLKRTYTNRIAFVSENNINNTTDNFQNFSEENRSSISNSNKSKNETFSESKNQASEKFIKSKITNNNNNHNNNNINNSAKNTKNFSKSIKRTGSIENENENEKENQTNEKYTEQHLKELHKRALQRSRKKVYDSLSENEDTKKAYKTNNKFFIDPNSKFKLGIDFLCFLVTAYAVIFLPLKLIYFDAFSIYTCVFEAFCDLIYIVDLLSGFFLAYYDFEENFITSNESMIGNYFQSFLAIDLLSAIPFNSVFEVLHFLQKQKSLQENGFSSESAFISGRYYYKENDSSYANHSGYYDNNYNNSQPLGESSFFTRDYHYLIFLNLGEVSRFCIILRLCKIFKIAARNEFIKSINNSFITDFSLLQTYLRILSYYLYFFVISHVLSCCFVFLGTVEYPNWIIKANLQDLSFIKLYYASLYFNHTTIFTVGYGDIVSKNIYERLYNIVLMIVGVMLYSFALTSISNMIKTNDEKTKNYEKKREYLDHISIKYLINKTLYDNLTRFISYEMKTDKTNKFDLLNELPITLRNEMILNMHKNIIESFNFFKNVFDNDFLIQVILTLKPANSVRNEVLIKQGDFIEEIIFIKNGILQLETVISLGQEGKRTISPSLEKIDSFEAKNNLEDAKYFFDEIHNKTNLNADYFDAKGNNLIKNNDKESNRIKNKNKNLKNFETAISTDKKNLANSSSLKKENSNDKKNTENKGDIISNKTLMEKIKILQLRKNEHFGDALMIENERSPLTLRTKTKSAELFLMNKIDVMKISDLFPETFEKIYIKSSYNFSQIIQRVEVLRLKSIKKSKLKIIEKIYQRKKQQSTLSFCNLKLNNQQSGFSSSNLDNLSSLKNFVLNKKENLNVLKNSEKNNNNHNNTNNNNNNDYNYNYFQKNESDCEIKNFESELKFNKTKYFTVNEVENTSAVIYAEDNLFEENKNSILLENKLNGFKKNKSKEKTEKAEKQKSEKEQKEDDIKITESSASESIASEIKIPVGKTPCRKSISASINSLTNQKNYFDMAEIINKNLNKMQLKNNQREEAANKRKKNKNVFEAESLFDKEAKEKGIIFNKLKFTSRSNSPFKDPMNLNNNANHNNNYNNNDLTVNNFNNESKEEISYIRKIQSKENSNRLKRRNDLLAKNTLQNEIKKIISMESPTEKKNINNDLINAIQVNSNTNKIDRIESNSTKMPDEYNEFTMRNEIKNAEIRCIVPEFYLNSLANKLNQKQNLHVNLIEEEINYDYCDDEIFKENQTIQKRKKNKQKENFYDDFFQRSKAKSKTLEENNARFNGINSIRNDDLMRVKKESNKTFSMQNIINKNNQNKNQKLIKDNNNTFTEKNENFLKLQNIYCSRRSKLFPNPKSKINEEENFFSIDNYNNIDIDFDIDISLNDSERLSPAKLEKLSKIKQKFNKEAFDKDQFFPNIIQNKQTPIDFSKTFSANENNKQNEFFNDAKNFNVINNNNFNIKEENENLIFCQQCKQKYAKSQINKIKKKTLSKSFKILNETSELSITNADSFCFLALKKQNSKSKKTLKAKNTENDLLNNNNNNISFSDSINDKINNSSLTRKRAKNFFCKKESKTSYKNCNFNNSIKIKNIQINNIDTRLKGDLLKNINEALENVENKKDLNEFSAGNQKSEKQKISNEGNQTNFREKAKTKPTNNKKRLSKNYLLSPLYAEKYKSDLMHVDHNWQNFKKLSSVGNLNHTIFEDLKKIKNTLSKEHDSANDHSDDSNFNDNYNKKNNCESFYSNLSNLSNLYNNNNNSNNNSKNLNLYSNAKASSQINFLMSQHKNTNKNNNNSVYKNYNKSSNSYQNFLCLSKNAFFQSQDLKQNKNTINNLIDSCNSESDKASKLKNLIKSSDFFKRNFKKNNHISALYNNNFNLNPDDSNKFKNNLCIKNKTKQKEKSLKSNKLKRSLNYTIENQNSNNKLNHATNFKNVRKLSVDYLNFSNSDRKNKNCYISNKSNESDGYNKNNENNFPENDSKNKKNKINKNFINHKHIKKADIFPNDNINCKNFKDNFNKSKDKSRKLVKTLKSFEDINNKLDHILKMLKK